MVIAVPQVHSWRLTRLDGDHAGVVRLTTLTSVCAEPSDELERVCSLAGLRVDGTSVGAVACGILLVHDSVEILGHELVARIHLHVAVRRVVRRNMWWSDVVRRRWGPQNQRSDATAAARPNAEGCVANFPSANQLRLEVQWKLSRNGRCEEDLAVADVPAQC